MEPTIILVRNLNLRSTAVLGWDICSAEAYMQISSASAWSADMISDRAYVTHPFIGRDTGHCVEIEQGCVYICAYLLSSLSIYK